MYGGNGKVSKLCIWPISASLYLQSCRDWTNNPPRPNLKHSIGETCTPSPSPWLAHKALVKQVSPTFTDGMAIICIIKVISMGLWVNLSKP